MKIDIPSILVHLRGRVVREVGAPRPERAAMARDGARSSPTAGAYEAAQRAAKLGRGPLAGAADAAVDALARAARGARADLQGLVA